MKPSPGRIVHYMLSLVNANQINRQRDDARNNLGKLDANGAVMHAGNPVRAGDVYPLVITRVWNEDTINGQVLLDGNDTLWVSSVSQLTDETKNTPQGRWFAPPREPRKHGTQSELPDAAVIEIIERGHKLPAHGVIVPSEIRINGVPLLCSGDEPVIVHEISTSPTDAAKVTLTLFARRVLISHEQDLEKPAGA